MTTSVATAVTMHIDEGFGIRGVPHNGAWCLMAFGRLQKVYKTRLGCLNAGRTLASRLRQPRR